MAGEANAATDRCFTMLIFFSRSAIRSRGRKSSSIPARSASRGAATTERHRPRRDASKDSRRLPLECNRRHESRSYVCSLDTSRLEHHRLERSSRRSSPASIHSSQVDHGRRSSSSSSGIFSRISRFSGGRIGASLTGEGPVSRFINVASSCREPEL